MFIYLFIVTRKYVTNLRYKRSKEYLARKDKSLKIKREITKYKYINWQQFAKGTQGKPNEQPFPRQVIQLPNMSLT